MASSGSWRERGRRRRAVAGRGPGALTGGESVGEGGVEGVAGIGAVDGKGDAAREDVAGARRRRGRRRETERVNQPSPSLLSRSRQPSWQYDFGLWRGSVRLG